MCLCANERYYPVGRAYAEEGAMYFGLSLCIGLYCSFLKTQQNQPISFSGLCMLHMPSSYFPLSLALVDFPSQARCVFILYPVVLCVSLCVLVDGDGCCNCLGISGFLNESSLRLVRFSNDVITFIQNADSHE